MNKKPTRHKPKNKSKKPKTKRSKTEIKLNKSPGRNSIPIGIPSSATQPAMLDESVPNNSGAMMPKPKPRQKQSKKHTNSHSMNMAHALNVISSKEEHPQQNHNNSEDLENLSSQYLRSKSMFSRPPESQSQSQSPPNVKHASNDSSNFSPHTPEIGTPYYKNQQMTFPNVDEEEMKKLQLQDKSSEPKPKPYRKITIAIGKDMSYLKTKQEQDGSYIGEVVEDKAKSTEVEVKEDPYDYHDTLQKYGYEEKQVISPSLQGKIIEAEYIDKESKGYESVIIKITNIKLHEQKRSNKNGKAFRVYENVIKEKRLLMYLTANNPPSALVRFEQFFKDHRSYFLAMEHGGEDFFDWIVQCHQWIRDGKLTLKQWNQYLRDLMKQITELVLWLHTRMQVCHLDISLENMLIKNNKWKYDKNGGVRLSRRMQVKFCDFGLAEFYEGNDFTSSKYVGKTHYKAPKVFGKKQVFDARAADIWSLGISFFMMLIGAPPYKLPTSTDDHFPYVRKGNVLGILQKWNREHYLNKYTLDLLNGMLCYEEPYRISIVQIYNHKWFKRDKNNRAHQSPYCGNLLAMVDMNDGEHFENFNKKKKRLKRAQSNHSHTGHGRRNGQGHGRGHASQYSAQVALPNYHGAPYIGLIENSNGFRKKKTKTKTKNKKRHSASVRFGIKKNKNNDDKNRRSSDQPPRKNKLMMMDQPPTRPLFESQSSNISNSSNSSSIKFQSLVQVDENEDKMLKYRQRGQVSAESN